MESKKERNYGVDLLRIFSMLMVVTLHVLGKGDLLYNKNLEIFSQKYNLLWILEIASFGAVNLYALISGYVSIKSKHKYTNLVVLWLEVVFYLLSISFIFSKLGIYQYSTNEMIQDLFPVSNAKYWYFTAYFCLFFIMPILNCAINNINKNHLFFIIISLAIIFCVIPIVQNKDVFNLQNGYHFFWLSYLYLIGGYIAKYNIKFRFMKIFMLIVYMASIYLTFLLKKYFDFINLNIGEDKFNFVQYTSPTILISSIALLLLFSNIDIKVNYIKKILTFTSRLVFSVYIIHEHDFVSKFFIREKFSNLLEFTPSVMIFKIFLIVFGIFFISIVLDTIRFMIFKILHIREMCNFAENFICKKKC